MKRYLVFICCFAACFNLDAQQSFWDVIPDESILVCDVPDKDEQVIKFQADDGELKEYPLYRLKSIYDLDVISYYKIQGYNTDLQKELYKETDEYKKLFKELQGYKDVMKETTFYYTHELKGNYDLNKGAFPYDIELVEYDYTEIPGYINHGTFCFEYATKRFPNNKIEVTKKYGGTNYFYKQKIYLPVKDKQTALKIEQAGENKYVLFVFKIDAIKTVRPFIFEEEVALTRTLAIYIFNWETEEIYCKVL